MIRDAPIFLKFDEVLLIHADQLARHGGASGLRDEGLLASALAQPESMFGEQFLHATLADQAAAYLFHLVKNHPFVDGNKRVGTATALVFLELNGFELDHALDEFKYGTEQTHLEAIVIQVASSEITKEDLAKFISTHARPLTE